jgi:ABC-type Zn uptake system ZnuABC Zn-binding protein ZnuA
MHIVENIAAAFAILDPRYADLYSANLMEATEELRALRAETSAAMAAHAGQKVALMNEALIYVAQDYDLEVAAWINRESGGALYGDELAQCIETLKASGARVVLIEQQAPKPLVDALTEAGFAVARIDILSTRGEIDGAEGYFEAQRANASALAAAFE